MIKVLGSICIIFGCSMMGIIANKRLQNHVSLLQDLAGVCKTLESEISSKLSPIPTALINAANALGSRHSICSDFINHVITELDKKGSQHFPEVWLCSVADKLDTLNEREKSLINELAVILGRYEADEQASALRMVRDGLIRFMQSAEQEKLRSGQVYMTLGTALGLGIVIILI